MRTRLFNSRPCFVLRKNSNGTSLVQFPSPEGASDAPHYTNDLHIALFDALDAVRSGQTDIAVVKVEKPEDTSKCFRWQDSDGNLHLGFEQATVPTKQLFSVSHPTQRRLPFVEPLVQMRFDAARR